MLQQYQKMIDDYKVWYPNFYDHTVECRPCGRYVILASLDDGSKLEFNSINNTIRDVTKFYDHTSDVAPDEETWRKEFGRTLRRLIAESGITQERLSDMTGISRQMLTRYVRGTSTPSGYILSRLSKVLNCDVRELSRFGYIDE